MFNDLYAAFGNYFWLAGVTIVTYLAMTVLKKAFLPVTSWLSSTAKGRRNANTVLGVALSIGFATLLGMFVNLMAGTDVSFMWFVAGGALANYIYILKERFADAEKMDMADAIAEAVTNSNKDVRENDFPAITKKVKELTERFKESESNVHAREVSSVATGIADAVGISEDEHEKLKRAIADIKEAGIDASTVEALYEQARSDDNITAGERDIIMRACAILRKQYGK